MTISKLKSKFLLLMLLVVFIYSLSFFSNKVSEDDLMLEGEVLAEQYCSGCHLLVSPDILPKRSWESVLGYMGYWLGIEDISYLDDHPEFAQINVAAREEILRREGVFPNQPLLSNEDWELLRSFFVSKAPEHPLEQSSKPKLTWSLPIFDVEQVNYSPSLAVTTLVSINETEKSIYIGDGFDATLTVLDDSGAVLTGPHIAEKPIYPIDIHFENGMTYIASIGDLTATQASKTGPAHIAKVNMKEDIFPESFEIVVDDLYRMADMNVVDLNGDSISDFIVSGFGAVFGNLSWFESRQDGEFEEHMLLALPGVVKSEIFDFNNDGLLDIIVLVSDAREGLHILENQGSNQFRLNTIFESHPAYGHTFFELADFNEDGRMDILVVNGDNVDSDPYNTNKNYHGLRIYINYDNYIFKEEMFYPMYGAFVAKVADFDNDNDLDIVASSFYPDFSSEERESFVYLENLGNLSFSPYTNYEVMQGRWMTMDVGDIDGDLDIDVVLGGGYIPVGMFANMELYEEMVKNSPQILILRNNLN